MTTLAEILESQEMAVAEALAANDHTGLTIPGIATASGVPPTTAARIVKRMQEKDILMVVGKRLKAPIFRFNPTHAGAVELARIALEFSLRVMDREEALTGTCEIPEPKPVQTGVTHIAEFQVPDANLIDVSKLTRRVFKTAAFVQNASVAS